MQVKRCTAWAVHMEAENTGLLADLAVARRELVAPPATNGLVATEGSAATEEEAAAKPADPASAARPPLDSFQCELELARWS